MKIDAKLTIIEQHDIPADHWYCYGCGKIIKFGVIHECDGVRVKFDIRYPQAPTLPLPGRED